MRPPHNVGKADPTADSEEFEEANVHYCLQKGQGEGDRIIEPFRLEKVTTKACTHLLNTSRVGDSTTFLADCSNA